MTDDQEQRVRDRAYVLWEDEGRPHGREEAHWHQARRELGMDPSPLEAEVEQSSIATDLAHSNRGKRAARTGSGEVVGSGAGAGGGGNPEDFDNDSQSGGGTLPERPVA